MLKDHKELIQKLNAHGVEYLIVGGHAVSLYSEPRGTKDLDVFINSSKQNSEAVSLHWPNSGLPLGDSPRTISTASRPLYFKSASSRAESTFCKE